MTGRSGIISRLMLAPASAGPASPSWKSWMTSLASQWLTTSASRSSSLQRAVLAFVAQNGSLTSRSATQEELQGRASLSLIVDLAISYPRGFATYCTVSHTVRAIGIGGSASLNVFLLGSSPEADARNLVALTRSKGLSVILLPTTENSLTAPYTQFLHSAHGAAAFFISEPRISTPRPWQLLSPNPTQPCRTAPSLLLRSPGCTLIKSAVSGVWILCLSVPSSPQGLMSRIFAFP